jgi:hypothetical protein
MRHPVLSVRNFVPLALAAAVVCVAIPVQAQRAGEVEFSRGVGFAQTPGQTPRNMGKGLALVQGDRLTTSEGGSAVIKLEDGTRMTVRPNTEMVLQTYQYKANAPDNSLVMQLLRGGFRAVTGLIAKSSPNAARIQTNTATIGIRGTDFDARVCAKDCGAESARMVASARPNAVQASAKLVGTQGEINALDAGGQRRRLVDGGSVFPGDLLETGKDTRTVLVFRDDTKISLGSNTRFRVDNFVYDDKNAGEGRFLVSLLRGSVRALTGLIAKSNTRNVGFSTATATVGIRGTGFDMSCTGACANEVPTSDEEGLTLFTWLGSIDMTPINQPGTTGQTALQVLQAGQGLFISALGFRSLSSPPPEGDLPRPDGVPIPPRLFSTQNVPDTEEGLFVFVRDGHIEVLTRSDVLQLGRGEAGFAGNDGSTARPDTIPKFLDFDRMPLPTTQNPQLVSILGELNIRPDRCDK